MFIPILSNILAELVNIFLLLIVREVLKAVAQIIRKELPAEQIKNVMGAEIVSIVPHHQEQ